MESLSQKLDTVLFEKVEQLRGTTTCVLSGQQFDNELLEVLPPAYFEAFKSYHKLFGPSKKPTFEAQFLDTRFFDINYEKNKLNPYSSKYNFESSLLKNPEPNPTDDFLVIAPRKFNGCLLDFKNIQEGNTNTERKTEEIFTTTLNHGMRSTYVFYNNKKNKDIYNVLFACKEEQKGAGYTLDQYIKDLELTIKKYERLLNSKIHDCYELFMKTHDILYENINTQLLQSINLGLQQIKDDFKDLSKKEKLIFDIDVNIEYVRGKHQQLVENREEESIIQQTMAYITELENLKQSELSKIQAELDLLEALKKTIIRTGLILEDEVKSILDPLLDRILEVVLDELKDLPFLNLMFTAPTKMIITQEEFEIVAGCDTSFLAVSFEDFLALIDKNLEIKKIAKCEA